MDDDVESGWPVSVLSSLGAAAPRSAPRGPSAAMGTVLSILQSEGAGGAGGRLAAETLEVDGLAVSIPPELGVPRVAWNTDPVAARLGELHARLAEGPGADALAYGTPVAAPDLAAVARRWPSFAPAALGLGVGAVFAFPVHVGVVPVGAVLAHRAGRGALSVAARRDARAFADAAASVLLGPSAFGSTAPDWMALSPAAYSPEIHQAAGMLSVQLGVTLAEALTRLRAYARSHGRTAAQVALDVVEHRLRLDTPIS